MRMQKGLCIELNGELSVFIGHSGEFVHGKPVGKAAVGEESFYYPEQVLAVQKRRAVKPVWAPIAAAAAVAILFLSVLLPEQEAFAYVQVQVNPGVELGIDDGYEVVSIRGLNSDGQELIGELDEWKHHPLEEVLDEVIVLSMNSTTDEIVITTVADDQDQVADEEVVESVLAISAKAMAKNVTVKLKEASKTQWRTSVEKSVPVGQLINSSQNLKNDRVDGKPVDKKNDQPLKVKDKPATADKQQEKELKATEKAEKKQDKNKAETKNHPSEKEKDVPPGQEKRKETPAVEKGIPNPPGQEKRNQAPGQIKKDDNIKTDEPAGKKEQAPGQQKSKENKGPEQEKGKSPNGNEKSSKAKNAPDKFKPAVSGPQSSTEKNNLKQPLEKSGKSNPSSTNGKGNTSKNKNE
ncbi:anti-sigma-I factor RsgI family protein [Planomicrobium okeanokoites]|uniref:anti-sigma-I factor RsgI family protein n=1 Tax=Planomicrobium okeanokoites TaxID=244 RepID=UPI00248F7FC9|nr:hypothetical protein [Planomicrobium okeanokoites]